MLAQSTIDQFNAELLAAHRVAINTLCELIAQPPADEADSAPHRHQSAQRTKLRFDAAVAILRVRVIKDAHAKAPSKERKPMQEESRRAAAAALAGRSPVLRERHDDALVTGNGDVPRFGVDGGHRPTRHDHLANGADAPADDRERPVLVHHQGAQ